LRNVLNGAPDPVVVGGFPTAQRNHLFDKAVSAFRQAWFGDRSPAPAAPPDLAGERFGTPLEVLLAAFDQALSNGASHGDSTTVERALDHEEHYWSFTAPRDLSDRDRRAAVALATLAGADDAETGEALLAVLPVFAGEGAAGVRWRTLRWLSELYAGSARLNPLRPDRLGEALVAIMLAEQDDGGLRLLRTILALADNAQVSRSLDLLARLATTDPTVAEIVALVLSRDHRALVERAEREAQGLPDRPGRLDLAIGLQRLLTTELVKRLDALAPDRSDRLALAMSYDKIGDLAWRSGRIDRAERLYGRAFFIRTRLAAAHQDDVNLARAQSISYNKLGDVAHRLSTSRARKLYERGLKIRERLARDNPDSATLASDLATSYDRLASVAAENGPRDQAERLYRRGLTIRERLARAEPDNPAFARDLAMSYDKLGDLAKEEGRPAAAKPLYEQGLAIRERLRAADLDNVTVARDLSNSYERLGDLAVDAKQFGQGRERYEQARQIRQRLSEAEPDNIILASDLARSYNRLGTVALMWDHRDEAHDLYERGLEIVERLRRTAPRDTALAHDASVFLSNLGDVATDDERHFDAEALYCRGLEVAQRLLATEPKNVTFARGVAEFYERRGQLLHHQPEARSRAETLLGAAVLFRRKLHDGDRERGDLAEELAYALLLLAETVGGEAADRLLNEIVVLLDGYEQSAKLTGRGQELRRLANDRLARR
jgi:tetratricopeptide (TPR) repeat protein